jgi:hypothetical protein
MLSALFLLAAGPGHSVIGTWDWFEDGIHSTIVFQAKGSFCRYRAIHPGYLVNRGRYTFKGDLLTLHGTSLTMNGRSMRMGGEGPGELHHIKWDSKTQFHWQRPGRQPHRVLTIAFKRLSGKQDFPAVGN